MMNSAYLVFSKGITVVLCGSCVCMRILKKQNTKKILSEEDTAQHVHEKQRLVCFKLGYVAFSIDYYALFLQESACVCLC